MRREETSMENATDGFPGSGFDEGKERYQMAVEAAELGTWEFFPLNGQMTWNQRCSALMGIAANEQVNYDCFLQHIHADDRDLLNQQIQQTLHAAENCTRDCECRLRSDSDQHLHWIRVKLKVYLNNKGEAVRLLGTVLDITEKKEYEQLLRQARPELEKKVDERTASLKTLTIELERSNQNLEEFAFMASHDLQEPLRKIRIFTQLLQEKITPLLSEANRLYLDKINASAIRMGALIKSLLDYSRLSGKAAEFEETDMADVVKTVTNDLELSINRFNAVINIDELPVIEAIPIQMVQLFTNLLSNALKFSCENIAPVVHIASRQLPPQEVMLYPALNTKLNFVEITIRDNGIGFDPAFSEQIFGIFQRLHGQNQYEGTGIGLSICRKIACNHNGLIFAKSQKNEGTTFHIILPMRQL